jgi:hypothetical protein
MAADGREVERIWHAGFGGAFGLHCGPDGRLYFSTGENQGGRRGVGTNWAVWSINPDGGDFRPEITTGAAGNKPVDFDSPFDFPAILSDGSLVAARYYDTRVYGELVRCPPFTEVPGGPTKFGHPLWTNNPPYDPRESRGGFQRRGQHATARWANDDDRDMIYLGRNVGHLSHPAAAPGNWFYCTWTGDEGDDHMDLGVYKQLATQISELPEDMSLVVDEPNRHEWMGKPLVAYREIYGLDRPATPKTKLALRTLPGASPFGVIGTSSVDYNEWVINALEPAQVKFRTLPNDEAAYIRVLAFNPSKKLTFGSGFQLANNRYPEFYGGDNFEGFRTPTNERTGYYEKLIPLKKWRTLTGALYLGENPPPQSTRITREDGRPDSSFRVEIPANQCWTLQLLNARHEAIVTANTWHQVTPAEERTDCRGCHAHYKPDPVPFDETVAASDEYPRIRLDEIRTIVFERDVKPMLPEVEQRPWDKIEGRAVAFESGRQSFDDNPAWTEEQKQLYRAWQDTGFLAAGNLHSYDQNGARNGALVKPPYGPYDDTMAPTLVVRKYDDCTVVGAFDPDSGLAAFRITADGKEVTDKFLINDQDHLWMGPAYVNEVVEVTATDARGNVTTIERRAVEEGEPFPLERKEYAESWNSAAPSAVDS